MVLTYISIENLKCSGCGSSIKNGLRRIEGVNHITVDHSIGEIKIEHTEAVERAELTDALRHLGYPEVGTLEGLSAVAATAKSYVSCAVGRMVGDN